MFNIIIRIILCIIYIYIYSVYIILLSICIFRFTLIWVLPMFTGTSLSALPLDPTSPSHPQKMTGSRQPWAYAIGRGHIPDTQSARLVPVDRTSRALKRGLPLKKGQWTFSGLRKPLSPMFPQTAKGHMTS